MPTAQGYICSERVSSFLFLCSLQTTYVTFDGHHDNRLIIDCFRQSLVSSKSCFINDFNRHQLTRSDLTSAVDGCKCSFSKELLHVIVIRTCL